MWLLQEICASILGFVLCLNHALTNTCDKVVCDKNMIESFNKIIINIGNHTLLTIHNYDDKFMSCDASSYEVGSVLSVVMHGDLKLLVAFYSRQLLPRERQDIVYWFHYR